VRLKIEGVSSVEQFLLISSLLLWVVVLLNLVLTLALIRRVNASPGQSLTVETGPTIREKAPDFSATTLDGETVTLSRYAGKATTFVFVAPYCQPCHELLPSLKTLTPQADAELVLVSDGSLKETQEMIREKDIQLPVLIAPREENPFLGMYNISMTPSYCSLDEQGVVLSAGHPGSANRQWQRLTAQWGKQTALF
jgi:methylamine dehydrogenase accessory protein MauD